MRFSTTYSNREGTPLHSGHRSCTTSTSTIGRFANLLLVVIGALIVLTPHAGASAPTGASIAYNSRTVFVGTDASLTGAIRQIDMGPGKIGWIQGWKATGDSITWKTAVERAGDYKIAAILESSGEGCSVRVTIDGHAMSAGCADAGWNRVTAGVMHLPAGGHTIVVTSDGAKPPAKFFSLEFVRPAVEARLATVAQKQRPSTQWMIDAGYGVMFHWTSQSMPRMGPAKSYCDAVRDFDARRFADMVSAMGAGFVIFTTSHAGFYFPGPNPVIDSVLPGRTCPRDLVGDLADALGQHHIRLELYLNPGHDDTPWWQRTHFDEPDKSAYFRLWRQMVAQIGRQYGTRLAGFWFDDAAFTYYPFNPSWQELAAAARTGNPDRLLTFNSWILPKLSDFYDVYGGENAWWEPQYEDHQYLPPGGKGRYTGGPQQGLQAEILAIVNDDWGHFKQNQPIGPPKMSADAFVSKMKDAMSSGEVPVLDVEIYQDGTISPETLRLFQAIRNGLRP